MSRYVLDHHLEGEKKRLALMSQLLDPMHRRYIESLGISRDIAERGYLFLLGSASTYLLRREDSTTARASFGPSFAVQVAIGAGFRL